MTDNKKKPVASPPSFETSPDDEQPEIYGITKGKNGIALNRRSFLSALAAAGVLAASPPASAASKNPPAAAPKTRSNGKAHNGKVDGLELRDKSLFSWDAATLKAWDIAKGKLKKAVSKSNLAEDLKQAGSTFPDLFHHIWDDRVLAFGPDGKTLATKGKDGITLWKSAKGTPEKIKTLKADPKQVNALAFHPDGTKLAAGNVDGSIAVWDLQDGNAQRIKGLKNNLVSLAFHPGEPILLSGHYDGSMRQWSLPDGKAGKTLNCHDKPLQHLAVTPDGKLVVTASDDKTIKLWSLPDAKQKASLSVPLGETTSALDLGANGQLLATGTPQGRIYLWRMPEGEMLGCLFDPALLEKGTAMGQYRQMGGNIQTQPCDKPLPKGATCVCDCVNDNRICSTTQQVCTCDTIAVPAGYAGSGKEVCVCNTIAVGTKAVPRKAPSGCSCVGNVTRGGGHYWRPN